MELSTVTHLGKGKTTFWPADLELIKFWKLYYPIMGVSPTVVIMQTGIFWTLWVALLTILMICITVRMYIYVYMYVHVHAPACVLVCVCVFVL